MPAMSTLKSNRTRAKNALAREEADANELLQREWASSTEQEIVRFCLSIGKVLLNLETKLSRLEVANDRLADAYDTGDDAEAARQFHTTLDEDGEFIDSIISKVSQLKTLKEEVDRRRRKLETSQTRGLEQRVTQIQEQMALLQSSQPSGGLGSIWSQPLTLGKPKPPQLDVTPFSGDVLKWKEFWDMFEAAVHSEERYANIDKFNCLKSKLTGDALEAISGYQLSNENYPVVVDVLKRRFGNKQLIVEAHYHNLSHLPTATNQASSLRQCYDAIERNLRSLEAIGEDVTHRHFIALICEKLPQRVLYQLYMQRSEDEEWTVPKLRKLLGKHISALEMAGSELSQALAQTGSATQASQGQSYTTRRDSRSTAGGLLVGNSKNPSAQRQPQLKCIYCSQPHWSDECSKYSTLQERRDKLKGSCFICLKKGHLSKNCERERVCAHCGKRKHHHRSLCPKLFANSNKSDTELSSMDDASEAESTTTTTANVLMQTATTVVRNMQNSSSQSVRVILDSGSQRTYITENLAKKLSLKLGPSESLSVVTFGMNQSKKIQYKPSKLQLLLKDGSAMSLNVNVVPNITGKITRAPLTPEDVRFLKDEGWEDKLADTIPTNTEFSPVDMLIGNEYYFDLLQPRKIDLGNGLFLFQSKLGWVFGGKIQTNIEGINDESTMFVGTIGIVPFGTQVNTIIFTTIDSPLIAKPSLEQFWNLESLGITESPSTCDDDLALDHFNKTVKFVDGRYMVTWPWKEENPDLPQNYQLAVGRLKSMKQRLSQDPKLFEQYNAIIQDQLHRGIIEKVTEDSEKGPLKHYIPHHAVITPLKNTTKVRVVYDASAKTNQSNKSLNECLYRGPVILPNLYGLLVRFRLSPIGVVSDIEKAFLNIGLQTKERDVTRFLWLKDLTSRNTNNNLEIYRFCRIPFGVISSPFLLGATITYHLQKIGTPVAERIQRDIYVDNMITGAHTITEAKNLYNEAKDIFAAASMNLREWASNSKELMKLIPEKDRATHSNFKVLGVTWNLGNDTLSIPGPSSNRIEDACTKREILQVVASIFDPLGYFAPAILEAKIFIQELWADKLEWDAKLQTEQLRRWKHICESLRDIPNHCLPRYLGLVSANNQDVEYNLVCFCDASAKAYATAVYLHQTSSDESRADLIFSKTRLASQKITIPRLELLGVLIGIRALKFIERELHLPISSKVLWTDSQCVLHWLKTKRLLSVFVTNRLKEIKSLKGMSFKYVHTQENPADLATRGKSSSELQPSIWWNGPLWLTESKAKWPDSKVPEINSHSEEIHIELKESKVFFEAKLVAGESPEESVQEKFDLSIINVERFSSLLKLLRTTAWILRYANKFMKRDTITGLLKPQELKRAKLLWDLYVQKKCYSGIIESCKKGKKCNLKDRLNLMLDEQGLLRCQGRYQNAELTQGAKCPKLLPRKEYYTRLLIEDGHSKILHSGVSQTLAQVRQEYWIPQGRREVKKVLSDCRVCRYSEGGPFLLPKMPPWPRERVAQSFPFEYTGLDYFGPLYIKHFSPESEQSNQFATKKVWVCLFTCLAIRAIHLELIEDMSAEEFLFCLRRFIARRGTPKEIISDNAKQFKTASTVLNNVWSSVLSCDQVHDYAANQGIQWKFIVDLAPWMGGFYERLVGLTKRALRKTIGNRCLTEKQLVTVLVEVETIVNSRPLIYVDDDINSSFIITPLNFLSLNPKHTIPDCTDDKDAEFEVTQTISTTKRLLETWKSGQRCLSQFWEIWRKEYLLGLRERNQIWHKQARSSTTQTPRIGDVVLIKENLPRGQWRVGRINKLIQGRDQVVRSAKVLLPSNKLLHRTLNQLYPIECPDDTIMRTEDDVNLTELAKETNDTNVQLDSNDEDYDSNTEHIESHSDPEKRPTRQATVAARKKLKLWLNTETDEDEFIGLGSVANGAK